MGPIMGQIVLSGSVEKCHAALVTRTCALLEGQPGAGTILLADANDPPPARRSGDRLVALRQGKAPGIEPLGNAGWRLTYADAAAPGTFAALLAAANPLHTPLCAEPAARATMLLAERVAASNVPVLVTGPTGTGKEVFARFIHEASPRTGKPFVAVNCAAMPEAMLEALLFGHQKGAFTGASASGEGFFRAADGGTLLLDEIAEMPLGLQAKLLRALQEGEVLPIGATRPVKVDVRVIACANRDLPTEVREGRFRADLYYRLNVFPLALTSLADRPADIAPLAFAMVLRHAGQSVPWLGEDALARLAAHGWPGNVRELENVIRRALVLAGDALEIGGEHIVFDQSSGQTGGSGNVVQLRPAATSDLAGIVRETEAEVILAALAECNGHRAATARKLGISERTLRYRLADMREAGISPERAAIAGAGR